MNTSEDKKTFYAEAALSLQNEGYGVERHSDEHLLVSLDGKPLCEVCQGTWDRRCTAKGQFGWFRSV